MICIWHNNRLDWLGLAWDFVYPILVGMWLNRVGRGSETKKEHEGFQFSRAKLDRDGERSREDIGMGCCSINI